MDLLLDIDDEYEMSDMTRPGFNYLLSHGYIEPAEQEDYYRTTVIGKDIVKAYGFGCDTEAIAAKITPIIRKGNIISAVISLFGLLALVWAYFK